MLQPATSNGPGRTSARHAIRALGSTDLGPMTFDPVGLDARHATVRATVTLPAREGA